MKIIISVEETQEALSQWLSREKDIHVRKDMILPNTHTYGQYEDKETKFEGFVVDLDDFRKSDDTPNPVHEHPKKKNMIGRPGHPAPK